MRTTPFYIRRLWSFSKALDLALVDEEIERGFQTALGERHGERVAYISVSLGSQMGLPREELSLLMAAGLLHDIGAVGGFRRYHGDHRLQVEHCLVGAKIIERFPSGDKLAPILKYHHEAPEPNRGALGISQEEIPLLARIVSLADKVDVFLLRRHYPREERDKFNKWLDENSGELIFSELVPFLQSLTQKESFWLDLEQPDLLQICLHKLFNKWELPINGSLETGFDDYLAKTFADLIDQKSAFTFRHSASVAETVELLAHSVGWDDYLCHEIKVAGQLHDLGKLAVPKKILDKPGPLDAAEIDVIRKHTYFTYHLLTEAGFPENIVQWAAYHHERLDGKGYPFAIGEKELSIGSRLMTIADMFAALTEERPYRAAMSAGQALEIIRRGTGTSVDEELLKVAERALL